MINYKDLDDKEIEAILKIYDGNKNDQVHL
jgi:hypothetical protein